MAFDPETETSYKRRLSWRESAEKFSIYEVSGMRAYGPQGKLNRCGGNVMKNSRFCIIARSLASLQFFRSISYRASVH